MYISVVILTLRVWSNRRDSLVAVLGDSLGMLVDLYRIRTNAKRGFYDVDQ